MRNLAEVDRSRMRMIFGHFESSVPLLKLEERLDSRSDLTLAAPVFEYATDIESGQAHLIAGKDAKNTQNGLPFLFRKIGNYSESSEG